MKLRTLSMTLLLAGAAYAQAPDLGVTFGSSPEAPQKRVELAKQLGAAWYRPEPLLLGEPSATCADCELARAAGLKLALVIRNSRSSGIPSTPVRDAAAFEQTLRELIGRYKPDLLIVESEPENQRESFSGTPEEYANELRLACRVAQAAKTECAAGGFSSATVAALATDQRWKSDHIDAAKFANSIEATRASGRDSINVFGRHLGTDNTELDAIVDAAAKYIAKNRAIVDRARALIAESESAGATYFNFHWFELQPDAVQKLIDILRELTKRPLMTDTIGQRSERPFETGEKIRVLRKNGVRPIIWSGSNAKDGVVGLVDKKGKLRATADAFLREAKRAQ